MKITPTPSTSFTNAVESYNSFFHSTHWQKLLSESFNCFPLYIWDDELDDGFALTIFQKYFFSLGYIGFPLGKTIKDNYITQKHLNKFRKYSKTVNCDILRVLTIENNNLTHVQYAESTFETEIENLQKWELSLLKESLKRNIKKAEKNCIIITKTIHENTQKMYELYQETVKRNKGKIRYNSKYFNNISILKHPNLHCFTAYHKNEIASFIVTVDNNTTTYYLHSMQDLLLQKYRGTDFLLAHAIKSAKERKMERFNMMSSPVNQKSLVAYKEKWGGITSEQKTWDIILHPVIGRILQSAMKLQRLRRR